MAFPVIGYLLKWF